MISVCMATYNGEEFVRQQMESILVQLSDNDEVIVSDDNSTDGTLQVIESFRDSRIKIYNANFRNLIKNFEFAISKAKGDIIFLADQDDVWVPNKVEIITKALETKMLVFTNAKMVDENLNVLQNTIYRTAKAKTGFWRNIVKNNYVGATMAFRREILTVAMPFPQHIPMHDQWLGILAEYKKNVVFLNQPLILYRRHANNVSNSGLVSDFSFLAQLRFRLNIFWAFLKRVYFKR